MEQIRGDKLENHCVDFKGSEPSSSVNGWISRS